eukprot:gnl/TRDRNA2_/TRDRNA2_195662_c0_seq1.p1 gnl/TRDRNA2_/TRDRNA2_195662_c0~~gnl/TRDRNA2_/TRDRNA2_195662_c0_seq1.p1  ORF type:complete len:284 (-),score=61.65 gnl/TRDRNA2_/TRDRNA2_195662_c0_seq1:78-929(-)
MVAVEDILTDTLAVTIAEWLEPTFGHMFFNLHTMSVPNSIKPVPVRWVNEVQIDEVVFNADGGDGFMDGGGTTSWCQEEGKRRLHEALQRLELSEEHVSRPAIDRMNAHELAHEKRRVKQELKRYDADFRQCFSRLPSHQEKEPMRPLYVYYRRLKTLIAQAEQGRHGRHGGGDDGARGGARDSVVTMPDLEETPRAGGARGNSVEEQIAAAEARLESLASEKSAVRAKLQAFQEKFVRENNRKIRFHKDILPIEREYRAYKTLKEEIMKVESSLRDLRQDDN